MTLDPARPEKTRRGVWGGVAPPVGLGFGMRPPPGSGSARNTRSGSARNTRNYPSRVQEGIWVGFGIGCWVWVGSQQIRESQISNISRILENVADLVNQIMKYDTDHGPLGIEKYDNKKYSPRSQHIFFI